MAEPVCEPCEQDREINPLLVLIFCPTCFISGGLTFAAGSLASAPLVFGVSVSHVLAPLLVLGALLAWITWGRWSREASDPTAQG